MRTIVKAEFVKADSVKAEFVPLQLIKTIILLYIHIDM